MKRNELIREVANRSGYTQKAVKDVLQIFEDVVFENIRNEGGIRVFDGLTLDAVFKEAHEGRNPATGEIIMVPAKYLPHAKFGKNIKEAVNR